MPVRRLESPTANLVRPDFVDVVLLQVTRIIWAVTRNRIYAQEVVEELKSIAVTGKRKQPKRHPIKPLRSLSRPSIRGSICPYRKATLPHALKRLQSPGWSFEQWMAMRWAAENVPVEMINNGRTSVHQILGIEDQSVPSQRDVQVIAATFQWLGTQSGQVYLREIAAALDRPLPR